ncbi:unnamed protein product [Psylliodes chrysocephalus]|uniref:Uncharacterized protein n=1 Tax=Psylliodes chrysocephalus TaxID=3402493 RepID=A0A9P0CM12_9CUCU|nr:unnamed protein product [Psylliodes chrysocephala]
MCIGCFPLGKVSIGVTMEGLEIIILLSIIAIKMYICQRKGFIEIIDYILNYEKNINELDTEICDLYKSYALYTKKMCISLLSISSMCGINMTISTLILYAQQMHSKDELVREKDKPLPYAMWRPVNEKDHYFICFCLDIISITFGCSFNTVTQLIFFSILTFVAGQLEILQAQFRRYGSLCAQRDTFEKKFEILKKLIVEHQQIIA